MSLIDALEVDVLGFYFTAGTSGEISVGTHYYGLTTSQPNEGGTSPAEHSGDNYSRPTYSAAAIWSAAPSNSAVSIAANVTFPQASGSWGTMTHFLLDDSNTVGGNHRFFGSLTVATAIENGDVVKFKTGDMTISSSGLFTHTAANEVLKNLVSQSATQLGATYYLALSTTTPTVTGTNFTEPSGGSYARVALARASFWAGTVSGDPTTKANQNAATWPEATASWGTVTHWGIYDASTGGTLHAFGALDSSEAIDNGEQVKFGIGDLTITMD